MPKYSTISNEYCVFDIATALYHWLQHNWNPQADELYIAFCKLTANELYLPGLSDQHYENISEDALSVYNELTMFNYSNALSQVLNYESSQ